jgi:hypothetical protein
VRPATLSDFEVTKRNPWRRQKLERTIRPIRPKPNGRRAAHSDSTPSREMTALRIADMRRGRLNVVDRCQAEWGTGFETFEEKRS